VKRSAAGALGVLLLVAGQVPAMAEPPDPNGNSVQINPPVSGPVVTQGAAGYGQQGINATASSSDKKSDQGYGGYDYSGPVYTYTLIPNQQVPVPTTIQMNAQGYILKPYNVNTQAACPPGQTGYYVWGPTGALVSSICVPDQTATGVGPTGPIGALAQQASSQQPWPNLVLGVNPTSGLTGVSSWFWLGGGSPAIPPATATAGPLTVTVQAALADIIWDFGDGIQYDSGSSLGRAYPEQSDISHVYQADSYGIPGGYTVAISVRYTVSYSVNGGPWTPLGIKSKVYSQPYTVVQAQPEGVTR
jgi:hypothetical protein